MGMIDTGEDSQTPTTQEGTIRTTSSSSSSSSNRTLSKEISKKRKREDLGSSADESDHNSANNIKSPKVKRKGRHTAEKLAKFGLCRGVLLPESKKHKHKHKDIFLSGEPFVVICSL
jgi:hypothetical protein